MNPNLQTAVPVPTGTVVLVVCDGCSRYLRKDGKIGNRFDATDPHAALNRMFDSEKDALASFKTHEAADTFALRSGWKILSQGECFCPDCTAPKTSAADSRAATNEEGKR